MNIIGFIHGTIKLAKMVDYSHIYYKNTLRAFRLEKSDKEITSHAGVSLIDMTIAGFTSLQK